MKSFQDILMEKMAVKPNYPSSSHADLDPAGLSFLLGNVGRFQFASKMQYPSPQLAPKLAPGFSASKPEADQDFDTTPSKAAKVRISGPAHKLSDQQKTSWHFFSKSGFALESDFSGDELKFSYHKLALLLHPDRGGYQQDFVDLKFHYDILKKLFTHNP